MKTGDKRKIKSGGAKIQSSSTTMEVNRVKEKLRRIVLLRWVRLIWMALGSIHLQQLEVDPKIRQMLSSTTQVIRSVISMELNPLTCLLKLIMMRGNLAKLKWRELMVIQTLSMSTVPTNPLNHHNKICSCKHNKCLSLLWLQNYWVSIKNKSLIVVPRKYRSIVLLSVWKTLWIKQSSKWIRLWVQWGKATSPSQLLPKSCIINITRIPRKRQVVTS